MDAHTEGAFPENAGPDDKNRDSMETLSLAQQEVFAAVMKDIAEAKEGDRQVILIESLSGTGKSHLLKTMQAELGSSHACVIDSRPGLISDLKKLQDPDTLLIVPVLPFEREKFEEEQRAGKLLPDYVVRCHVLQGMREDEIRDFIAMQSHGTTESSLSVDAIATYSMGIPLIAQRIMSTASSNNDAAIVAAYELWANKGRYRMSPVDFKTYLTMPIPEEVADELRFLERRKATTMYNDLSGILSRIEYATTPEESPLFRAAESLELYNRVNVEARGNSQVTIYVPSLNREDFQRIQEAFGVVEGYDLGEADRHASRPKIFGANYRKTLLYTTDGEKKIMVDPKENTNHELREMEKMKENFMQGDYPLSFAGHNGTMSFFISKWEHGADTPLLLGWAVESFLQQRGIPYIADMNWDITGMSYAYHPETQSIVFSKNDSEK